jgi:hypothetical protein
MNRSFSLAALALGAFLAAPAQAHHSFAMFDSAKQIEIEGTIKEFAWTNPHVGIYVVVAPKDGKPETVWTIEATSPGNLSRMGWNKTTFKPGDRVKMTIRPLRTGEPGGAFSRALIVDTGKEVTMKNELPPDAGKY